MIDREQFEAWFRQTFPVLPQDEDYIGFYTAWSAWQAARQRPTLTDAQILQILDLATHAIHRAAMLGEKFEGKRSAACATVRAFLTQAGVLR